MSGTDIRLKSFEIDSYQSCMRTKFSVQDALTGLIGINGSGKSNILNAILLLKKTVRFRAPSREDASSLNRCRLAAEVEHRERMLFIRGSVEYETDEHNFDDVCFSELKFNFREFTDYQKWVNVPVQSFSYPTPFSVPPSLSKADPRLMDYLRYYHITSDAFDLIQTRKIRRLLNNVFDFFSSVAYYSASQFSDPSRCPVSIELEENRPLRRPRTITGHERFIMDLYQSWKSEGVNFKRYENTVNTQGIGLVDSIQFIEVDMPSSSYEVKVGGKVKKIERNRLLVVPKFVVKGIELSPNQLSEGTFKTLALIYYILTDDSKLLLIEEPEVCVHHGLLDSVISLIKMQSKQKQIVMSTHSDFVLDHLAPENLMLVEWHPLKGTTATPLNKSMSKSDYRELKIYLRESGNLGEFWKEGGFKNG